LQSMRILGVESTCDETSAAVVEDGRKVLSNVVASSSAMHEKYGGIVPEVAAREQIRSILPVLYEAILNAAQIRSTKSEIRNNFQNTKILNWATQNVDAIAVAYGPGLIGSLLIGVETAKSLALAWDKPLIGVNHLDGHLYANWLEPIRISNLQCFTFLSESTISNKPEFPAIGLVVSGGHTDLVCMESHDKITFIGATLDDAAGEVLDKVGRILGLGYPGGPAIEREASKFSIRRFSTEKSSFPFSNSLPIPMAGNKGFDFSFSGLKTAIANRVQWEKGELNVARICYELQERIFQSLIKKTNSAVQKYGAQSVVIGGGVSANESLRNMMSAAVQENGVDIYFPQKQYSTDNGAMIAAAAFFHRNYKEFTKLQADPSLSFS